MSTKKPPKTGPPVAEAMAALKAKRTAKDLANLDRFGITASDALGVSVSNIQAIAKKLGRSHDLALGLWATGCYEARMLAVFVDEPERVTPAQMDAWTRDFDNWGICDTACFHLFDRTPHAWRKIEQWSGKRAEFVKRAGFALLASVSGHDRESGDAPFLATLPLIEKGAADERDLVKKGVSWALRRMGTRSAALHAACVALARKLEKQEGSARWVGKDALRDLARPAVVARVRARKPC